MSRDSGQKMLSRASVASDDTLRKGHKVLTPLLARAAQSEVTEQKRIAIQLATRLSKLSDLPIELIASVASLARQNRSFFRVFVENQDAGLPARLVKALQCDLQAEFASLEHVGRLSALCASLVCAPTVAAALGRSSSLLLRICEIYDAVIPMILPPRTSFQAPLSRSARLALQARLDLLECVHEALRQAYFETRHSEQKGQELAKLLIDMSEVPTSFTLAAAQSRSLVTLGLMGDLEAFYGLSGKLAPFASQDDATYEYLVDLLRPLVPEGLLSGLELLVTSEDVPEKGKAKAVEAPSSSSGDSLDAAVAQVQAVLPERDAPFLRRCLQHPDFANAAHPAEALVDALLSGILPPDLLETSAPESAVGRSALASLRANVFEDRMDMSKVTKGKQRLDLDANSELSRRIDEDLKRNILAFASDDTERDEQFEREREIELDDYDPEAPYFRHRQAAEGDVDEGAEEDDNVPDEGDVSPAVAPPQPGAGLSSQTTRLLERAYIGDPGLFAPTERMRTTAARKMLCEQTGLAHDLIESWAKMLERNPDKDRILARHATVHEGNERGLVFTEESQRGRGRGNGRGRGGRGGPRGNGRGQHMQRVRGHDRKINRVGGPG